MPFLTQASNAAGGVDSVFLFIFVLSAIFLVAITSVMVYFVFKYNRKRHPKGEDIEGHALLETVWTVTPTVLFLVMFYFGWTNYGYMRAVPRDAMEITVTARQWAWSFTYPNGRQTTELVLALDKPVKLNLRSLDVIHGFFVPAFRIKEDVVPGKENYTWFAPTKLGTYDIECTVICGVNHGNMVSKAVVVPVADFQAWYFGDAEAPIPGQNRPASAAVNQPGAASPALAMMRQKDCLTCHSIDGTAKVGPTFKAMYGRKELVSTGNGEREVIVDDARLAVAIRNPNADVVKGYAPAMPVIAVSDAELAQIIEFIKTEK